MPQPTNLNFFMPPEWHTHKATLLAWPNNQDTFTNVEDIKQTYIQIIKQLIKHEQVLLLVKNQQEQNEVTSLLKQTKKQNLKILHIPTVDVWIRDYGPTILLNKKSKTKALINWTFNAWGNKYERHKKDNAVTTKLNKHLKLKQFKPRIILEPGAIETNGSDLLLTTEHALINKNRNPKKTKQKIEQILKNHLGIKHILWLKKGLIGDDTDSHIDNLARFVNKNTILTLKTSKQNPNCKNIHENHSLLKTYAKQHNLSIKAIPLPTLKTKYGPAPASYLNFYIANNIVLVPIFNHKNDNKALQTLKQCFPKRKIVPINSQKLIEGNGTIHCITQQIPK